MRLLEMLTDRFGVFEALAHSTIELNRCTARAASGTWAETKGLAHHWEPADGQDEA